jgi:hypothetical protein
MTLKTSLCNKTFKFQLDNLYFGRTMSLRHFDLRIRMYMFDINQQLYKHHTYTIATIYIL